MRLRLYARTVCALALVSVMGCASASSLSKSAAEASRQTADASYSIAQVSLEATVHQNTDDAALAALVFASAFAGSGVILDIGAAGLDALPLEVSKAQRDQTVPLPDLTDLPGFDVQVDETVIVTQQTFEALSAPEQQSSENEDAPESTPNTPVE